MGVTSSSEEKVAFTHWPHVTVDGLKRQELTIGGWTIGADPPLAKALFEKDLRRSSGFIHAHFHVKVAALNVKSMVASDFTITNTLDETRPIEQQLTVIAYDSREPFPYLQVVFDQVLQRGWKGFVVVFGCIQLRRPIQEYLYREEIEKARKSYGGKQTKEAVEEWCQRKGFHFLGDFQYLYTPERNALREAYTRVMGKLVRSLGSNPNAEITS